MADVGLGTGGEKAGLLELADHRSRGVARKPEPRAQLPIVRERGAQQPADGGREKAVGRGKIQQRPGVGEQRGVRRHHVADQEQPAGGHQSAEQHEQRAEFRCRQILRHRVHHREIDRPIRFPAQVLR